MTDSHRWRSIQTMLTGTKSKRAAVLALAVVVPSVALIALRSGEADAVSAPGVFKSTFKVLTAPSATAAGEGQAAGGDRARDALAVLAAERARPGLAGALSRSRVSVIQAGPLNARGRRLGLTMWVTLATPRRDVRATVPGYLPRSAPTGPAYTPQTVRMHVAVLRDALIDVDLTTRRVIAFEPGPRSRTVSWQPLHTPVPAGAGD
jgi:hypothetical protein